VFSIINVYSVGDQATIIENVSFRLDQYNTFISFDRLIFYSDTLWSWDKYNSSSITLYNVSVDDSPILQELYISSTGNITFGDISSTAISFTVDAPTDTITLSRIYVYGYGSPYTVYLGNIALRKVSSLDSLMDTHNAWYYSSGNSTIYIRLKHHSPLNIVISYTRTTHGGAGSTTPTTTSQPTIQENKTNIIDLYRSNLEKIWGQFYGKLMFYMSLIQKYLPVNWEILVTVLVVAVIIAIYVKREKTRYTIE